MTDTWQWCFSSLGCTEADLPAIVALADGFAVPLIELRGVAGSLDLGTALASARQLHPELWARLVATRRVRMLGSSFLLLAPTAATRAELLACAAAADACGCPYVRVFGRRGDDLDLAEADLEVMAGTLAWWHAERARLGLRCELVVETHDVFSSSVNCQRLRARSAQPLAILWDVHHTWHIAGEDPAATWAALGAEVRHVHVKDSRVLHGRREHVLPGAGDAPIPQALALLRRVGFAGAVSLEWERHWEPHLPPLVEALRALDGCGWRG